MTTTPSPVRPSRVDRQALAYNGLLLFTVLLYLRPNELLPIGTFPIVKLIGLGALAAFFFQQLTNQRTLSVMPREFKYLLGLAGLMVLSIPLGLNPTASFSGFTDDFLKVLLIFMLMINVVTSLVRLRRLLAVTTLCATTVALGTLVQFTRGIRLAEGFRATGIVGGIFGNPNDLALALNILLPIAVALALICRGPVLAVLYWGCAASLMLAVLITYSRAGFLTLVGLGAFLSLRLRRRYPAMKYLAVAAGLMLVLLAPENFSKRILTVFDTSGDAVAAGSSAEIRWSLLRRSIEAAGFNPVRWLVGLGVYNFHIVSVHEYAQHNAYLQVFNEVGLPAFILYLMLLTGAIRMTGRIVRAYDGVRGYRHIWILATAIQTSLVAYAIGSFFAPVAYLWYLYYIIGFAVCLKQIVVRQAVIQGSLETPSEPNRDVWHLRRIQH